MKATECYWFACVHAMRPDCSIRGYLDAPNSFTGEKQECPHYKGQTCVRVKCELCRREGEKGICPNYKEDESDETRNG